MKSPTPAASRWHTAAAALLAALVPVLVFWRGALLRGVFFQADLVVYYLPAYTYATRVLRSGLLPLWAPEMEGGQPFHAQWEPSVLYPLGVPFRFLLPPWWALNLYLIFHYALAAVGMFAYARRLSLSRSAALVSAALYCVNGFMIAHLEHPNLIVGAAWLPWLLIAVERGLGGQFLGGALGMAAVLGMMLLGGHPDLFLMGTLLVGLLVLLHPVQGLLRKRRPTEIVPPLLLLFGGYGLGVMLAAAQMLPTLDLARLSWERHGASTGYQDTWSLRPVQFLVQLLPDLFGRNGQDTYWGMAHYWEECSYVGALALALAIVGLASRHRLAQFYGGLAVLSVWLATGTRGLAFLFMGQLPAFGTMRVPCRYMFLFDLSVAVLAGIGAHWLSCVRRPTEKARARWLQRLLGGTLALVALWLSGGWLGRHRFHREMTTNLALRHSFHTRRIVELVHRYEAQLRFDACLLLGGLLWAVLLVGLAIRYPRFRGAIPPLGLVGVVATLFLFGSAYHTVIPARWVAEPPFTVAGIRATSPAAPFRVLQWDSIRLHADVAVHRGWWPTDERGYRQYIAALPGNYNLVWGLSGVRQEEWSALPLRYTRQLTSAILAKAEASGFGYLAPYLRWWNTAYVISRRPLHDSSLSLVDENRIHLYRTRDPGHRAWIVHQATIAPDEARLLARLTTHPEGLSEAVAFLPEARPSMIGVSGDEVKPEISRGGASEGARVVSRSGTRITVEAVVARPGYLVLGESWAPDWQAWVDGAPAPILRANLVHRAVPLLAGQHQVEFQYRPTSFRLGLYLSAAALAMLLALATVRLGRPEWT